MLALSLLAYALVAVASPVITPPPVPAALNAAAAAPTAAAETIPVASCLLNIECCQNTVSLPDLSGALTSLLPGVTSLPIPLPTLGPLVGVQCSAATDANILGNQW